MADLVRLKELGYCCLYFDESEPEDEWVMPSTAAETERFENVSDLMNGNPLIAVPLNTRRQDLDNAGWLSISLTSLNLEVSVYDKLGKVRRIIIDENLLV